MVLENLTPTQCSLGDVQRSQHFFMYHSYKRITRQFLLLAYSKFLVCEIYFPWETENDIGTCFNNPLMCPCSGYQRFNVKYWKESKQNLKANF